MTTRQTKPGTGCARRSKLNGRSGAALLITLLILALMTIIVVAFLGTMSSEVQASRRSFESQKARGIAVLGLHTAVSQLRTALGPWDTPYGNEVKNLLGNSATSFLSTPPTNYWSTSPGILTSWTYSSASPATNYPLFSLPAGGMTATTAIVNSTGVTATANLNAQAEDGTYPILGTATPLQVDWVNVLANPGSTTASAANPVIGRYAFWVDDENSKININTADGVLNTNQFSPSTFYPAGATNSTYMGAGTPTEVSLEELQTGGNTLSLTAASNIVAFARISGFNSPREILRYTGGNLDVYTNNIFNLTTFSRSPDLNIFGQPRMPLIPANKLGQPYQLPTSSPKPSTNEFYWNLATLQPLKELFPSQAGGTPTVGQDYFQGVLPGITLKDLYSTITTGTSGPNAFSTVNVPSAGQGTAQWPLAFLDPLCSSMDPGLTSTGNNNGWDNGQVIASYLAGTNVTGSPIIWPAFPGAPALTSGGYIGTTGNNGKYTPRQIDSITMQILDLASKDTSPDIGCNQGPFPRSSDSAFRGWLSGRLVNGGGRNPKLDKVLMLFTVESTKTYTVNSVAVHPPDIMAQLYMEFWFPSRFSGVSLFHDEADGYMFNFGDPVQVGYMNCQDMGSNNGTAYIGPGGLPRIPTNTWLPGYTNGNVGWLTNTASPYGYTNEYLPTTPDGLSDSYSYWQNNLLRVVDQNTNCAGVDWVGRDPNQADPQTNMATRFHSYAGTNSNSGGHIVGAGATAGQTSPVFYMNPFVQDGTNSSVGINTWAPGEYRCVSNKLASMTYKCPFSTNATNISIQGGIAYCGMLNYQRQTDPDDVPLDAMRGTVWPAGEPTTNVPTRIATPNGERVYNTLSPYTNILNAVIPMATVNGAGVPIHIPVPVYPSLANYIWVYGTVPDPLVSKFPGDWNMTVSGVGIGTNATCPAPSSMQYTSAQNGNADSSVCAIYPESAATISSFTAYTDPSTGITYQDPDSYWLPTIDNNANTQQPYHEPFDAPQIPRTSRFPSVGYLQYVRTGIMPDFDDLNSSVSYLQQHGTPYRLLDFNQISDASQTLHGVTYPDWAMLDLFYVPSSLLGYNSPYEMYAGGRTVTQIPTSGAGDIWSGNYGTFVTYSNTNAVNNMARFGTYGGATSGRINPNGSVVYTTNMNIPTPGITRTVPLQALLHGLVVNQTQALNAGTLTNNLVNSFPAEFHGPNLSAGTAITPALETNLANAIVTYLNNNPGVPLRMPAEICNIPAIASYAAVNLSGVGGNINNPTRNDLVRQIVGNLTTQSNTFSIWVEAQSITKSKGNSNWGLYESGNPGQADDQITGTVRYHFIVERDFDAGLDGVYGSANLPGPDGVVGTLDDASSGSAAPGNNPPSPSYFYKIIYEEEIR